MAFELFTDETSVLRRYKIYKIGLYRSVYTNDIFFSLSFLNIEREKRLKNGEFVKKYAKRMEEKKKIFGYISCRMDIRK